MFLFCLLPISFYPSFYFSDGSGGGLFGSTGTLLSLISMEIPVTYHFTCYPHIRHFKHLPPQGYLVQLLLQRQEVCSDLLQPLRLEDCSDLHLLRRLVVCLVLWLRLQVYPIRLLSHLLFQFCPILNRLLTSYSLLLSSTWKRLVWNIWSVAILAATAAATTTTTFLRKHAIRSTSRTCQKSH
jgi:hypothetical protein